MSKHLSNYIFRLWVPTRPSRSQSWHHDFRWYYFFYDDGLSVHHDGRLDWYSVFRKWCNRKFDINSKTDISNIREINRVNLKFFQKKFNNEGWIILLTLNPYRTDWLWKLVKFSNSNFSHKCGAIICSDNIFSRPKSCLNW